ncbi:unnamed protein product [Arabis nemorensis]|uniref:UBA domain-containing protein n=1 Tax=Arabis nemorensis TaxID=586526 RepID=A0A565BMV4_9BRAS|nr:unnamed protein product [Arabis nemorensis]
MSCVCSELRDKCVSDHLWNNHMEKKWSRLMGDAAVKEWNTHVSTIMSCLRNPNPSKRHWSSRLVANLKPFSWLSSNIGCCGDERSSFLAPVDSVIYWYSNLENGKFWFPAQVYNRENGHVGFMMSCYDAKIRYDYKTDTFQARYSAHGRRAAEENVTWQRLRPTLVEAGSRDLHLSDCLEGWWYGIVGHLQNCDGENNCRCHNDENVVMEFRQFRPESPWRTTVINRKNHRETGNEENGFYGGVKKLGTEEEISTLIRDELATLFVVLFIGLKMNGGPSGFNNAPVTKAFVIATGLFTVFFGIRGGSSKLGLSYQDIFEKLRIWKLIKSTFAFSSTPELFFGLYLMYYFRVFERQIGSNKHSVFILFSGFVSLILQAILLSLFKDPTANLLTSGPYALIFASFVPFYLDIPVSKRFHVLGVHFSDKSFIYLAGVQLLLSSWRRSFFPGICGIIAGSLYRLNIFGVRKAKLPEFMASLFSRISLPSLSSQAPRRASPNLGRQAVRSYRAPMPSLSTEPSEEAIATLVSMGFDQNAARQALVHARNDVNAATNILLEAHSH